MTRTLILTANSFGLASLIVPSISLLTGLIFGAILTMIVLRDKMKYIIFKKLQLTIGVAKADFELTDNEVIKDLIDKNIELIKSNKFMKAEIDLKKKEIEALTDKHYTFMALGVILGLLIIYLWNFLPNFFSKKVVNDIDETPATQSLSKIDIEEMDKLNKSFNDFLASRKPGEVDDKKDKIW